MRSDIPGFNAPIKQKGGLYFYDDPYYSILSISLTDSGLLKKILETLIRIRPEVNHPELEILIEKLTGLSGIKPSTEIMEPTLDYRRHEFPAGIRYKIDSAAKTGFPSDPVREAAKKMVKEPALTIPGDLALCWGDVLGLIHRPFTREMKF